MYSTERDRTPMRRTDEQKKAALQQRIAALKEKVQRIEKRGIEAERRNRVHVGIVVGWGMIEHAIRNPDSEVRRVASGLIEAHLRDHPNDHSITELLARLTTTPESREAG